VHGEGQHLHDAQRVAREHAHREHDRTDDDARGDGFGRTADHERDDD
jgi:hypothetical protein